MILLWAPIRFAFEALRVTLCAAALVVVWAANLLVRIAQGWRNR